MVGWIKVPLGVEAGLGPGDILLDGDPAPPMEKGTAAPPPLFGPCIINSTIEHLFHGSSYFV